MTNQLQAPLKVSYKCGSQQGTIRIVRQKGDLGYFVHDAQHSINHSSIYKEPVQQLERQSIFWAWLPNLIFSLSCSSDVHRHLRSSIPTDWPLHHIPFSTTYNTFALNSKTVWVTVLNRKTLPNLLPSKPNFCDQARFRVSSVVTTTGGSKFKVSKSCSIVC